MGRNLFDEMQPQTAATRRIPGSTAANVQRVGAFSMLPMLLRRFGADPVDALAAAGLVPSALDDPEDRIPFAALGPLLAESVIRTRCAHFGLIAGRVWHLSDLGIVGELMRQSPTVRDALQRFAFYQHLNSECAVAFVREVANVVELGWAIYGSELKGLEPFGDTCLAAGVNFLRELCGPAWAPSEVLLAHASPRDTAMYRQFFKVQPRFNAEVCAIRFPASWMNCPVEDAEPIRLRIAEQQARAKGRPRLLQQVYRALRILLLSGKSSGDDVANVLSMHRRTLNRRLKAQATTFQIVLDQLRFEVACQLLSASEVSLDDVAAVLGYAGVSPFMRSFRRWAGTTPGRWRRLARRGDAGFDGTLEQSEHRRRAGTASLPRVTAN